MNWSSFIDQKTKREYYYNSETKVTTWYKPPEIANLTSPQSRLSKNEILHEYQQRKPKSTTSNTSPTINNNSSSSNNNNNYTTTTTTTNNLISKNTSPKQQHHNNTTPPTKLSSSGGTVPVEQAFTHIRPKLPKPGVFSLAHMNSNAFNTEEKEMIKRQNKVIRKRAPRLPSKQSTPKVSRRRTPPGRHGSSSSSSHSGSAESRRGRSSGKQNRRRQRPEEKKSPSGTYNNSPMTVTTSISPTTTTATTKHHSRSLSPTSRTLAEFDKKYGPSPFLQQFTLEQTSATKHKNNEDAYKYTINSPQRNSPQRNSSPPHLAQQTLPNPKQSHSPLLNKKLEIANLKLEKEIRLRLQADSKIKSLRSKLKSRDEEMKKDRSELKKLANMLSELVITIMRKEQLEQEEEDRKERVEDATTRKRLQRRTNETANTNVTSRKIKKKNNKNDNIKKSPNYGSKKNRNRLTTTSGTATSNVKQNNRVQNQQQRSRWDAALDPKTNRTYYVHSITKETAWQIPLQETTTMTIKQEEQEEQDEDDEEEKQDEDDEEEDEFLNEDGTVNQYNTTSPRRHVSSSSSSSSPSTSSSLSKKQKPRRKSSVSYIVSYLESVGVDIHSQVDRLNGSDLPLDMTYQGIPRPKRDVKKMPPKTTSAISGFDLGSASTVPTRDGGSGKKKKVFSKKEKKENQKKIEKDIARMASAKKEVYTDDYNDDDDNNDDNEDDEDGAGQGGEAVAPPPLPPSALHSRRGPETTVDLATRKARRGASRMRNQRATMTKMQQPKINEIVEATQPMYKKEDYIESKRQSMETKALQKYREQYGSKENQTNDASENDNDQEEEEENENENENEFEDKLIQLEKLIENSPPLPSSNISRETEEEEEENTTRHSITVPKATLKSEHSKRRREHRKTNSNARNQERERKRLQDLLKKKSDEKEKDLLYLQLKEKEKEAAMKEKQNKSVQKEQEMSKQKQKYEHPNSTNLYNEEAASTSELESKQPPQLPHQLPQPPPLPTKLPNKQRPPRPTISPRPMAKRSTLPPGITLSSPSPSTKSHSPRSTPRPRPARPTPRPRGSSPRPRGSSARPRGTPSRPTPISTPTSMSTSSSISEQQPRGGLMSAMQKGAALTSIDTAYTLPTSTIVKSKRTTMPPPAMNAQNDLLAAIRNKKKNKKIIIDTNINENSNEIQTPATKPMEPPVAPNTSNTFNELNNRRQRKKSQASLDNLNLDLKRSSTKVGGYSPRVRASSKTSKKKKFSDAQPQLIHSPRNASHETVAGKHAIQNSLTDPLNHLELQELNAIEEMNSAVVLSKTYDSHQAYDSPEQKVVNQNTFPKHLSTSHLNPTNARNQSMASDWSQSDSDTTDSDEEKLKSIASERENDRVFLRENKKDDNDDDVVASMLNDKLIKKLSKRQNIVNELISTERSYVDSLHQLDTFFIQPLSVTGQYDLKTKLMSSDDYQIIFSGIQSILNINQEFLTSNLEPLSSDRKTDGAATKARRLTAVSAEVGRAFARFAPVFAMYSDFVSTYEKSSKKLIELKKKSKKLNQFLNEITKNKTNGMTLESFLIMPIQRVPRYKMLLSELLNHTMPSRADHKDLTIALSKISEVALKINASINTNDDNESMLHIQQLFNKTVEIMKPARVLKRMVNDVKVSSTSLPSQKTGTLYIFNDMIVVGIASTNGKMKPFHPPYNLTTKLNEEQMFISDTTMTLNQEDDDSDQMQVEMLNGEIGIEVMDLISTLAMENQLKMNGIDPTVNTMAASNTSSTVTTKEERPKSTKSLMNSFTSIVSTKILARKRRKSLLKVSSGGMLPPKNVKPPSAPTQTQRKASTKMVVPPPAGPPPAGPPPAGPPPVGPPPNLSPPERPPQLILPGGLQHLKSTLPSRPPGFSIDNGVKSLPPPPGPPPNTSTRPLVSQRKTSMLRNQTKVNTPASTPPGIPSVLFKSKPTKGTDRYRFDGLGSKPPGVSLKSKPPGVTVKTNRPPGMSL